MCETGPLFGIDCVCKTAFLLSSDYTYIWLKVQLVNIFIGIPVPEKSRIFLSNARYACAIDYISQCPILFHGEILNLSN